MVCVLVSNRKHVSVTSTSYWSQSLNPPRRECTCKSRYKQYERLFEPVTFCTSCKMNWSSLCRVQVSLVFFRMRRIMELSLCVHVCRRGGRINQCRICHSDICVPWRSSGGPLHLCNLQLSALTPFGPPLVSTTRPGRSEGEGYVIARR